MAMIKRVLCPERLRHVPPQFSVSFRHACVVAGRTVAAAAG